MRIGIDDVCHVTWAVRSKGEQHFLHAIGEGKDGNQVTEDMAQMRFDKSRYRTPWLPILFPQRALTHGRRSRNCATAAAVAFSRGWLRLP